VAERFSTTPLHQKLGVKDSSVLALLHAPTNLVLKLPTSVDVRRRAQGRADVILSFYTRVAELERQIEVLGAMIFPSGGLWIAWPKKSSGVSTDLTDHGVRDVALPLGLVDNKVCAIDETWTAMRLVWRLNRRTAFEGSSKGTAR
jgi:hypothetical protein